MKVELIDDLWSQVKQLWSFRVAAFWGAVGGIIIVLSAYLNYIFDWKVGLLLILASISFAVARAMKQPGTEE